MTHPLTLSPLKLNTVLPSTTSVPLLLGFAYCPAIRPTRTTGILAPQIKINEKLRMSPILALTFSPVQASKDSAQSPACRRKASLRCTRESWWRRRSIWEGGG